MKMCSVCGTKVMGVLCVFHATVITEWVRGLPLGGAPCPAELSSWLRRGSVSIYSVSQWQGATQAVVCLQHCRVNSVRMVCALVANVLPFIGLIRALERVSSIMVCLNRRTAFSSSVVSSVCRMSCVVLLVT